MIRIGMTDPESVVNRADELIAIMRHPNVYKFLHLPVQSASDHVLRLMRRRYKYEQYKQLVLKLEQAIPQIVIDTDIIVGFPGETDEDHKETLQMIADLKF